MKTKLVLPFVLVGLGLPALGGCHNSEIYVIKFANHNIKQSVNLPRDLPDYGEESIQVHYYRQDGLYDKWGLWCWSENAAGAEYPLNYQDDFGGIAYYPLSTFANAHSIGFIVKELFSSAGADV